VISVENRAIEGPESFALILGLLSFRKPLISLSLLTLEQTSQVAYKGRPIEPFSEVRICRTSCHFVDFMKVKIKNCHELCD